MNENHNASVERAALVDAIAEVLAGRPVNEFLASFPEVAGVIALKQFVEMSTEFTVRNTLLGPVYVSKNLGRWFVVYGGSVWTPTGGSMLIGSALKADNRLAASYENRDQAIAAARSRSDKMEADKAAWSGLSRDASNIGGRSVVEIHPANLLAFGPSSEKHPFGELLDRVDRGGKKKDGE